MKDPTDSVETNATNQAEEQPTKLYRFRSTSALLGHFKELENQEIYFAAPEELNDPLEGFKDIFWKGDEILWPNLLRHYLLCLCYEVLDAKISAPDDPTHKDRCAPRDEPRKENCFVRATEDALPTEEFKALFQKALGLFLDHEDIPAFTASLARRIAAVKRDELTTYIRSLHLHALNSVLTAMESIPGQSRAEDDSLRAASSRPLLCRQMSEHLERAEREPNATPGLAQMLAAAEGLVRLQQFLLAQYRQPEPFDNVTWRGLVIEYPTCYVRQLEQLLYSDWYTACFVESPKNAAMWGNYGDGHKGVCLEFETPPDATGHPSITLFQEIGIRSAKTGPEPVFGHVTHPMHKIRYKPGFAEIDFFRSLGTLNRRMLSFWLMSKERQPSPRATDIMAESEAWRNEYWNNSILSITTKLSDWSHELEYRATLQSTVFDFSDRNRRKLKYRFHDLSGVIFGLKTSTEDKLRIMRVIGDKCGREGRTSFNFQQAHFSNSTGKFEIVPLKLLERVCNDPIGPPDT